MSAQYRPYRDEESVDGMEATSWTDNEPGTIQIYEKTTEELPYNQMNRRQLYIHIALLITVGSLGLLVGYMMSMHPAACVVSIAGNNESILHDKSQNHEQHRFSNAAWLEDATIKDKVLVRINGKKILEMLTRHKDSNRTPGSAADHSFAYDIEQLFNSYEFDHVTRTNHTFKTMLPERASVVQLLSKSKTVLYSNIDSEQYEHEDMRPYLPLSQANQTVITTNQILYINRGLKEDYARLSTMGLSANETEGKVLIIRQTFHQAHDVVVYAQESGATAVLLFPDPDIYGESSPYPNSMRLPKDAGRSHPTAWSNYGDLATFNLSSIVGIDTSKLGLDKEAKVHIPVVPISYNTAAKLLRGLSGAQAPAEWNCFDFTLYVGPAYKDDINDDQRDMVRIMFYNKETSITSSTVTGTIAGSVEPDRYIVVGSRRDSLNRGLLDSVSGTSVMLEIARVFGALVKEGWRPRRTIIFNSFGAETLNLISSSNWLEVNQRLLHARVVAYVNCDQIVTGNHTAAIAASPLLYQVVYNSTKQVPNPNFMDNKTSPSVYDAWRDVHQVRRQHTDDLSGGGGETPSDVAHKAPAVADAELERILGEIDVILAEAKLPKAAFEGDDMIGSPGSLLREYRKSATTRSRPSVRRLDLQSIYSPFFLYAGIPVIDVRYAGFTNYATNNKSAALMLEDLLPLIGTKYDNMFTIQQIDPHLKYHVAVARILAEMLRDLSDSVFLPYNLLDYAVTLKDSFNHLVANYGKTFAQSNVDLEPLRDVIYEFARAAIKFHQRQDALDSRDALAVRKINDQLMLLERAFLDSHGMQSFGERKHIILSPNDGTTSTQDEGFPLLVDWITLLEGGDVMDEGDYAVFVAILKVHYKAVIHTISNAIKVINEVHIL